MRILAIETCGAHCGAGLWQDERLLAHRLEDMERGQDARLMPMIAEVMAQAGRAFADLDRVAVARGPGSFTGTRVGLAAARGIGLAAGKPVIGIDRFSIYRALHAPAGQNALIVINSKRAELFCKFYPAEDRATEPFLMTKEEIDRFMEKHANTLMVGDMPAQADERVLFHCAALSAKADPQNPDFRPSPLYIRAPDVTVSKG